MLPWRYSQLIFEEQDFVMEWKTWKTNMKTMLMAERCYVRGRAGGQGIRAIHIPLSSTTQSTHHQGPSRDWRGGVGVQLEVIGGRAGGALWTASLLTPFTSGKGGDCVSFFVCFLGSSALQNTYAASQTRYNNSFIVIKACHWGGSFRIFGYVGFLSSPHELYFY